MSRPIFHIVLLANVASSLMLAGLIWFVQVVHYPLFAGVGRTHFVDYERRHSRLTTRVVGPLMIVDAVGSVGLLWSAESWVPAWAAGAGVGLTAAIWISTFAVQVPCHSRLEICFEDAVHRRLVQSNWIRTLCWSLRGFLGLFLLWQSLLPI